MCVSGWTDQRSGTSWGHVYLVPLGADKVALLYLTTVPTHQQNTIEQMSFLCTQHTTLTVPQKKKKQRHMSANSGPADRHSIRPRAPSVSRLLIAIAALEQQHQRRAKAGSKRVRHVPGPANNNNNNNTCTSRGPQRRKAKRGASTTRDNILRHLQLLFSHQKKKNRETFT